MIKDAVLVLVTCASVKEADYIADILLDKKLISCANVLPGIRSKFRWNGKIEKAKEVLIMAKTRAPKFAAIDKEVRRIHSYEVPEIVALPIISGSDRYLNWIADSLK
ncbi:MAG: divalent-cation tolerance protein CutA [Candidatus Omnitrophica bacterium]|nr:divalent-cation tolerance protein CutA [Candidatus Omnitrophota bacterium]